MKETDEAKGHRSHNKAINTYCYVNAAIFILTMLCIMPYNAMYNGSETEDPPSIQGPQGTGRARDSEPDFKAPECLTVDCEPLDEWYCRSEEPSIRGAGFALQHAGARQTGKPGSTEDPGYGAWRRGRGPSGPRSRGRPHRGRSWLDPRGAKFERKRALMTRSWK